METDGGVSIKHVKLKVLYTFDSEHKNNHLARWPQSLEVQAASVDESTVIGIIQLRTCLEAVTNASPELTSSVDNDYTVYAYDYSEPDTPLVGQGMLSRALYQDGEDQDSEAMITGKITKSVMGLFSKNAQETLEVKLRLTPVIASFARRRSGSVSSNADTVQQHWNSLSQTNGAFGPASPRDTTGLETVQRMLSEGGLRSGNFSRDAAYNTSSRPTSRAGTPTQSQPPLSNPSSRPVATESRPNSRASMSRPHVRRDSFGSGYYSGEDNADEGPARKRAKIQKVDWPSKTNFNIGRHSDSLRITASAASSLRLHRPTPQHPGVAALQNRTLEEPVRPPTPVPGDKSKKPRGRPKKVISPNLLRGPKARQSSPAPRSQDATETSLSSPEDVRADSVTSTPAPADLPSSPPVMHDQQNFITSPALPPLITEMDSGFMSGNLEDLFDEQLLDFGEFLEDKPDNLDQETFNMDPDLLLEDDLGTGYGETIDPDQSGREMPPPNDKCERLGYPALTRTQSLGPSHRSIAPAPRLAPLSALKDTQAIEPASRNPTTLPQIPASDPVGGRTFRRANTWAPDMSDAIMSDAGPMSEDPDKMKPKKRVGKEQTKARLENAIASGEMPPFCNNCGAIETPAWRRAFIKYFNTPFDDFQTSLEPGECCFKELVQSSEESGMGLWKGYRTEKRPEEKSADVDGWAQICLCNPCGLWFHKFKYPRPSEKWQKRDPNEKRKRKRGPKPKKRPARLAKSDALTPASDESSPADTLAEGEHGEYYGDVPNANGDGHDDREPQLPPMPRNYRAGSAEPAVRGLGYHNNRKAKVARRVQSSPAGRPAIALQETNRTPNAVRRQLFPSPDSLRNKANMMASTSKINPHHHQDSHLPTFVRRSPRLNKSRDVFSVSRQVGSVVMADGDGKENVEPMADDAMFHDDLFFINEDIAVPPMTPTPTRRSERLLFKTPGKTPTRDTGCGYDTNALFQSPSMNTPRGRLHPAASILLNSVQRNLNPAEMTPFTRSIHDALHNQTHLDFPTTPKPASNGLSGQKTGRTPQNDKLFDFPDLPSLKGSSPLNGASNLGMNFSELTTDQLHTDYNVFSTDAPMPSSPPPGYFNFLNLDGHEVDGLWDDMTIAQNKSTTCAALEDEFLPDSEVSGLRRSPRRHAA